VLELVPQLCAEHRRWRVDPDGDAVAIQVVVRVVELRPELIRESA
jgi:hypothetical protein